MPRWSRISEREKLLASTMLEITSLGNYLDSLSADLNDSHPIASRAQIVDLGRAYYENLQGLRTLLESSDRQGRIRFLLKTRHVQDYVSELDRARSRFTAVLQMREHL